MTARHLHIDRSVTTNLFIVNTPVQILNAVEARNRFHSGERNLLVIMRSPLRKKQASRHAAYCDMLAGLVDDQWHTVWTPKLTKIRQVLFPAISHRFIKEHQSCNTVYTGSFQSREMHVINSIDHDKLVLIDDGNGIHETIEAYGWAERRVTHRLSFMKTKWPSGDLHVFSCYDVDETRCRLIRNDYRFLRQAIPPELPVREKEIVFVSQPLDFVFPNISIRTQELLDSVRASLSADRCRYLAHPREPTCGPGRDATTYPVELFPIREGYLPRAFVTFFSSAARTLRLLYPVPVVCLRPPEDFWPDPSWAQLMSRCYAEFAAVGASIQEFDSSFYVKDGSQSARAPWAYRR